MTPQMQSTCLKIYLFLPLNFLFMDHILWWEGGQGVEVGASALTGGSPGFQYQSPQSAV